MKTFNIGDKVRIIKDVDGIVDEDGKIVNFDSESYSVELSNGRYWYVLKKLNALQLIGEVKKPVRKDIKMTKENTLSVKLERRENGKTYFAFEVPERITSLYKERSSEVKQSESWKGLQFYAIPELLGDETYKRKLNDFNLVDDFGDGFIRSHGGRFSLNIAWIRTIGGTGEIEVKNEIGHSDLNMLIKNMLEFLKTYFEDYLRAFVIKGQLTIDF
jgi:hypothetical protein